MGAREHVYIFLLRADIYIALVQYSIKIKLLVQYSIKIKYEQVEDLLVARILLVLRFLTALAWHTSDGGTEELTLCKEMGARGCLCVAATCAGLAGWLASMLLVHVAVTMMTPSGACYGRSTLLVLGSWKPP